MVKLSPQNTHASQQHLLVNSRTLDMTGSGVGGGDSHTFLSQLNVHKLWRSDPKYHEFTAINMTNIIK